MLTSIRDRLNILSPCLSQNEDDEDEEANRLRFYEREISLRQQDVYYRCF